MKRFLPTKIRARRAGFTMLEMMLAVMLLGLVLSTVYTIWSASLTAWKRGSDAMDKFQRQRVVIDAINELASSAVLFQNEQGLYTVIGQKGAQNGADSISFVTASDVLLPAAETPLAGLRRVTISLQRDESGYPYLAIQNSPALTPTEAAVQAELHVLSADVTGFSVRYRNSRDGTWVENWDDRALMPGALEFTIAFGGADGRTEPVIMTRAIELPTADYAMQMAGVAPNGQNAGPITNGPIPTTTVQTGSGAPNGSLFNSRLGGNHP